MDLEVQKQILENTKKIWYNVFAPEYFLMRVPCKSLPLIFEWMVYVYNRNILIPSLIGYDVFFLAFFQKNLDTNP